MKSPLVEDDWDIKFAYGIKKQQKTHTTCLLVKCFHCRLAAIYVSSSLVFWQYFKNTCKASHVLQTFLQPHTSSPKSMKHEQQPLVYILFQPISPPPQKKSTVVKRLEHCCRQYANVGFFFQTNPSTWDITHIWVVWNRWMPSVTLGVREFWGMFLCP